MAIQNRYEFVYYVSCVNANPNGDPDMGNTPRIDPETRQGFITDVATKRRIRNYILTAFAGEEGMDIIIQQHTNFNKFVAQAKLDADVEICAKTKKEVYKGRQKACSRFYDVRTFGAVMSTGPNAGQVRGPVQITFGKSLDPILPLDISITRMGKADDDEKIKVKSVSGYEQFEETTDVEKLRTMGRKQLIPFGLYEVRGFISANLAAETGFDDADFNALREAILNMYEHDRSASKGEMAVVSPLILFKHVGTDSDENQRIRQAKLGCAPAHRLFELVHVQKKPGVEHPRSYKDYDACVEIDKLPVGVEIGFQRNAFGPVTWGVLPEEETWFRHG